MRKITLIAFIIAIIAQACVIEKRHYLSGYNFQSKSGFMLKKNNNTSQQIIHRKSEQLCFEKEKNIKNDVDPVTKINIVNNEKTTGNILVNYEINDEGKTENPQLLNKKCSDLINNYPTDSCDKITLKTGDEISAKVLEIGITEIKYKNCNNLNGPVIIIKNSDVWYIDYANGTRDIIKSQNTSSPAGANRNTDKKGGGFGIVSIVTAIIGLFIGAIILGPTGIIFGIVGMNNRKLQGLAIAGFIIGFIDIIGFVLVLGKLGIW